GVGPDVTLDPEVLRPAEDPRAVGVGIDRLEADPEPADLGQVLGLRALPDPADAAHVIRREGTAVVPDLEPAGEELERHLARAGILGVLDQLEDEMRSVAVELAEQLEHGCIPAVAGNVVRADLVI